jgi:hypothetical protein
MCLVCRVLQGLKRMFGSLSAVGVVPKLLYILGAQSRLVPRSLRNTMPTLFTVFRPDSLLIQFLSSFRCSPRSNAFAASNLSVSVRSESRLRACACYGGPPYVSDSNSGTTLTQRPVRERYERLLC